MDMTYDMWGGYSEGQRRKRQHVTSGSPVTPMAKSKMTFSKPKPKEPKETLQTCYLCGDEVDDSWRGQDTWKSSLGLCFSCHCAAVRQMDEDNWTRNDIRNWYENSEYQHKI